MSILFSLIPILPLFDHDELNLFMKFKRLFINLSSNKSVKVLFSLNIEAVNFCQS